MLRFRIFKKNLHTFFHWPPIGGGEMEKCLRSQFACHFAQDSPTCGNSNVFYHPPDTLPSHEFLPHPARGGGGNNVCNKSRGTPKISNLALHFYVMRSFPIPGIGFSPWNGMTTYSIPNLNVQSPILPTARNIS